MGQKIMKMVVAGGFFCMFASAASAATPAVTSFTANPATINHTYASTFSWSSLDSTAGQLIFVSCPDGITIQDSSGAAVSCDAARAESVGTGSDTFNFFNISGTAKTILAKYIPIDSLGVPVANAAVTTSVTVGTAYQTIADFSASSFAVNSGDSVTLSWTGLYAPGVNLQFDCNPYAAVYDGAIQLPCGAPAFANDLAISASRTITIKNTSNNETTLTVRALPAVTPGAYDGTHSRSLTLAVKIPAAAAGPSVSSFSASANAIASGGSVTYAWGSSNTAGTNLQFNCSTNLIVMAVVGEATTTLPCNTPAFSSALAASGTQSILVINPNTYPQILTATLFPRDSNGVYLGTLSKTATTLVLVPGTSVTPPAAPAVPAAAATTTAAGVTADPHAPITIGLEKGMTNPQVSILQTFLARDKSIYPGGLVTGYFGVATDAGVKSFQIKYGIAKPGDSGYGYVGPKTRAKINSLVTP
jgi:hypothetical protein